MLALHFLLTGKTYLLFFKIYFCLEMYFLQGKSHLSLEYGPMSLIKRATERTHQRELQMDRPKKINEQNGPRANGRASPVS